jgi:hypothetical protein
MDDRSLMTLTRITIAGISGHRAGLAGPALLLVTVLALSGCAGTDRPAEVVDGTVVPPAATVIETEPRSPPTTGDTQISAYRPPIQPTYARPEPKRAVAALLRRAEDQRNRGNLDAATVSLERALRIAPDEPLLWHELAAVRMAQRRPDLVVQLAAKSNALASPQDRQLRGDNWRLIADARRALGDSDGAREAERRAMSYD